MKQTALDACQPPDLEGPPAVVEEPRPPRLAGSAVMLCGVMNRIEAVDRRRGARAPHNAALHVIKGVERAVGIAKTRELVPVREQAVLGARGTLRRRVRR
jgi:hypothetical protein